jgi:agmatinase
MIMDSLAACQLRGSDRDCPLTAISDIHKSCLPTRQTGATFPLAAHRDGKGLRMTKNSYDSGRLNLPFVGISTFGKRAYEPDWSKIDADVAVMGAPFDFGTQWRAGARFGPRAIREASTLFSFGHAGAYDHDDGVTYLDDVTIVDIGDADIIHTNTEMSHANIEKGVRAILAAGALPVVLGGDHSINIPCINAFSDQGPIHLVQIDAHLDFVDERHGVRNGHGNPMRRAAEKDYVTGLSQIGIRNVSSTAKEGYETAISMGSDIITVRGARRLGTEALLARIPEGVNYYLTIDIDGFDPSIAPGTGTPSHGGFLYYEVLDIIAGLAERGNVVGIDLVEVAPDYDHTGTTAILAAQVLLNTIGRIFHFRKLRAANL